MQIKKAFFVNESSKRELLHYDIDSSKVSMLMQQEGIKINAGPMRSAESVELFNNYNRAFYASQSTDTIVFYSKQDKQLAIISNEFSQILFVYKQEVLSIQDIKPIIESALQPNKNWKAYEIVY